MRHADFEKIHAQFQTRYCTGEDEDKSLEGGSCPEGQNLYAAWLTQMSLDETKPYSPEDQFSESFGWAKTLITRLKEEDGVRLYKVDACFPLSSMNRNVYTEEELIQAARMLKLVTPNLNHTDYKLPFTIEGAQYEDGAVELLVSTSLEAVCPKGYKYVDMLEHSEDVPEEYHIIHVSIEGDCTDTEETDEGNACVGLGFTGIAFLTKKVLPGIPLTRIVPVEKIMEHVSFSPPKGADIMTENKEKDVETDEEPTTEEKEENEDTPQVSLADINEKLDLILEKLEPEQEPEPEPVCGDCGHYVDGKCELDDSEKNPTDECDKASFTPKAEPTTKPTSTESIKEPFAGYDDFEDCVAKNQDKDDPEAYCAAIKKQAEEPEEESVSEEEEQDAEEPEESEGGEETATEEVEEAVEAPTKSSYISRYKELKEQGKSARDAWRLAGFELIERIQNK